MPRALFINDTAELYGNTKQSLSEAFPDIKLDLFNIEQSMIPISKYSWSSYAFIIINESVYFKNIETKNWIDLLKVVDEYPPVLFLFNKKEDEAHLKTLINKKVYYASYESIHNQKIIDEINLIITEQDIEVQELETEDESYLFDQEITITDETVLDGLAINKVADSDEVTVPGYEIIKPIGKGAMSIVFLAKRLEDNLNVVLKVMFTRTKKDMVFLRQFMQEYKLLSSIDHANIVTIYERGFASNFAYIAIEYLPNGDLRRRMNLKDSSAELALNFTEQIAAGLKAAHEVNIIHRDIKPANILFKTQDILSLTDFGAARDLNIHPEDEELNNMIVGTPYYMSPEQGAGAEVDERSDIYSLGIIFYELLMGQKPYVAKTINELIMLHNHAPIPRLPAHLAIYQSLIDGLIAKDPDERFLTADDVLAGIDWVKKQL